MVPKGGELEQDLRDQIRMLVLQRVSDESIDTSDFAKRLDLLPSGATALLERDSWSIAEALRIAEAFQIVVKASLR